MALQKAQTTAIYAGLQLWPSATTAALVRSQLTEDGTYPGAVAAFEAAGDVSGAQRTVADFDPAQPRDDQGRWTNGGVGSGSPGAEPASASKPAPAEHGSGVGTLGAVLSQFNPVSSAAAEELHPTTSTPLVVAAHIHEDPINPEPSEGEQEKQLQEQAKELDDRSEAGRVSGRMDHWLYRLPWAVAQRNFLSHLTRGCRPPCIKASKTSTYQEPTTTNRVRAFLSTLTLKDCSIEARAQGLELTAYRPGSLARKNGSTSANILGITSTKVLRRVAQLQAE